MPEDFPGPDPDLENYDPDRPSLAEEAFEQLGVVNTLRQSAQNLSGKQCKPFGPRACHWQCILEQVHSIFVMTSHCCPWFMQHPWHIASADLATDPQ